MKPAPLVSISVVSHNQGSLVHELLADLDRCRVPLEVILTLNVPERLPFQAKDFGFPITLVENERRKGFGSNHNYAYSQASGGYFCVLNPDIRISGDPFPLLIRHLDDSRLGVLAPKIVGVEGGVEDSARQFPTPFSILRKALRMGSAGLDYSLEEDCIYPDWIGGMFMLFRSDVFGEIGGFDERYFLYYEDVDLCARLHLKNYKVALCTNVSVVHDARRESRRNLKYLTWHLSSMAKFFLSPAFVKIQWLKRKRYA